MFANLHTLPLHVGNQCDQDFEIVGYDATCSLCSSEYCSLWISLPRLTMELYQTIEMVIFQALESRKQDRLSRSHAYRKL